MKFEITYYPVFLNICNILEEVYALLVAEKEQKIQFQHIPVKVFLQ